VIAGTAVRRENHWMRVTRRTRSAPPPPRSLLDAGVDTMEVKELLGHRHVSTTPIYDKRRRAARRGASHKMPL
jgi:integrase